MRDLIKFSKGGSDMKQTMQNAIEFGTNAKFYRTNRDIFLRYFDNLQQYEALIAAGNFKKMEEVIKLETKFSVDDFIAVNEIKK
jgi:hypothetical protein